MARRPNHSKLLPASSDTYSTAVLKTYRLRTRSELEAFSVMRHINYFAPSHDYDTTQNTILPGTQQ